MAVMEMIYHVRVGQKFTSSSHLVYIKLVLIYYTTSIL